MVLAFFGTTIASSDSSYSIDSVYKVNGDGTLSASLTLNATNTNDTKTPANLTIPLAGSEASSITAKVNDQDVAAKVNDNQTALIVELPNLTGNGKTWKVNLSYKSKVLKSLGNSSAIILPTMDGIGLTISNEKRVVRIDLKVGLASALPQPTKTDIATGEQIFTYENKTGPVPSSATLLFNDEATALVEYASELKNNGWWFKDVELTLPPDTNQQQVILSSIEPMPSNVRLDQDGNILAQFRIGPKKSINVSAKVAIKVNSLSYDTDSDKLISDISQSLKDLYTKETDKWNTKTDILAEINPVAPASEIANTIYDAVVKVAKADNAHEDNVQYTGSKIFQDGSYYADILIGHLRAVGIPARAVLGKLVSDGQLVLDSSQSYTWVEAYLPDTGWMTMDPGLALYADYYGKSDYLHVGLALWGVSDHLPPIDLNSMNIVYSEEPVEIPEDTPGLKATKTVIFPGISIMTVDVAMPAGVITDNNAVQFSNQLYLLGSLAPYQKAQTKVFKFGAAAFSNEQVEYGYTDGQVLTTSVVTAQSSTSYVFLIAVVVGLVILAVLIFVIRRRLRARKYKPSKDSLIMHDEDSGGEVEAIDLVGDKPVEPAPMIQSEPMVPTDNPPNAPVTRGTINSSEKSYDFQKPSSDNPRRHIIQ